MIVIFFNLFLGSQGYTIPGASSIQAYDVIIIGADHNGLVCAGYLLKAGYSVLLLEKRLVPGGAATTEECMPEEAPGFKFNWFTWYGLDG